MKNATSPLARGAQFAGNVTSTCQSNGTWYELACGPRGAELLSHREWLAGDHTAGYARFDARIVDSFAARPAR